VSSDERHCVRRARARIRVAAAARPQRRSIDRFFPPPIAIFTRTLSRPFPSLSPPHRSRAAAGGGFDRRRRQFFAGRLLLPRAQVRVLEHYSRIKRAIVRLGCCFTRPARRQASRGAQGVSLVAARSPRDSCVFPVLLTALSGKHRAPTTGVASRVFSRSRPD